MLHFEKPIDIQHLRSVLAERLLELPRFGAKALDKGVSLEFESVPHASIDMTYHVVEVEQERPWTPEEVNSFVSSLNEEENMLDVRRP
eukprot:4945232-Prymnesium_polylepis.1